MFHSHRFDDVTSKICDNCSEEKPLTGFPLRKKTYRGSTCNSCLHQRRKEREAGRDDLKEAQAERIRAWKKTEKGKAAKNRENLARRKRHAEAEGREYITHAQRCEQLKADKQARNAAYKEARANGLKTEAEIERASKQEQYRKDKPWLAPGLSATDQYRIRYQNDDGFRQREVARVAARKNRYGSVSERVRLALNNNHSRCKALDAIADYSIDQLKSHIISRFTEGMTWELFRAGAIHLDHIRPLASFDFDDPEQLREAWQLDNLQPLWARDNILKGASWDGDDGGGA